MIPDVLIHGEIDTVVPIGPNSAASKSVSGERRRGSTSPLQRIAIQGHNFLAGIFQLRRADFNLHRPIQTDVGWSDAEVSTPAKKGSPEPPRRRVSLRLGNFQRLQRDDATRFHRNQW